MSKPVRTKIVIDGENKGAITAFDQVGKKIYQTERDIKGFGGSIGGTLSSATKLFDNFGLMATGALAAVASGFIYMVKQQIDVTDQMQKTADRLGTTIEYLSTMKYVASLSGIEFNTFTMALQRFTRRTAEAAGGTGESKKALEELGIQLKDNNGNLRSADELLLDVADKLNNVSNGGDKVRIAFKLFDAEGVSMLQMLKNGSEGIKEFQERAREMGLEISTETARDVEAFNDSITTLKGSWEGLANNFLSVVAEPLSNFFSQIAYDISLIQKDGLFGRFSMSDQEYVDGLEQYRGGIEKIADAEADAEEAARLARLEAQKNEVAIKSQMRAAEQLQKQWESTFLTMQTQIDSFNMGTVTKSFFDLNQKVDEFKAKFGDRAEIEDYRNEMMFLMSGFDSINPAGSDNRINFKSMVPDIMPFQEFTDQQIMMIEQVTAAEILNYGIREGYAQESFNNMSSAMMAFYQLSGEKSKAAFIAYKAFSIGEAIISTYKGAAGALAMQPVTPWNFILASSIIAAGLANVAQIASASPGQGGGGGTGGSAPPRDIQRPVNETPQVSNNRTVTIEIHGNVIGEEKWVRDNLIPQLLKAYGDGA